MTKPALCRLPRRFWSLLASRRRSPRRVASIFIIAGLAVGASAAPAFAHAALESTNPVAGAVLNKSPLLIDLNFSEPINVDPESVRIIASTGEAIKTDRPTGVPGSPEIMRQRLALLDNGTYVVTWRIVSADAHPIRGAFTFSVGEISKGGAGKGIANKFLSGGTTRRSVDISYAVVRGLVYLAMAILIGGLFTSILVWRRALELQRVRRILWVAWGALGGLTILAFGLQGAYSAGKKLQGTFDPSLWSSTWSTRMGTVLLVRVLLVAALLPSMLLLKKAQRARWWIPLTVALLIAVAVTPGLGGHASVGSQSWIAMLASALHVLGISTWIGGLVLLILLATSVKMQEAIESLPTWSRVAKASVLVVVLTGVARGYRELGGFSDIFGSTYGRLLSLKVGIVLVTLLVATLARDAIHRRWELDPEELAAADEERETLLAAGEKPPKRRGHSLVSNETGVATHAYVLPEATARRRLLRSIFAELLLMVFVIGVTAVLVNTVPARSLRSGPWSATLEVGELTADVNVSPARTGANEVHLTLNAPGGGPAQVLDVSVEFSLPSSGIAPIDVEMRAAGIAHYTSVGFTPPVAGDWSMTLKLLVDPITEVSAAATVPIR